MVKPAAIHITKKPPIQNNNVLKTNEISAGSATATSAASWPSARAKLVERT
jgi:hypothetical protein